GCGVDPRGLQSDARSSCRSFQAAVAVPCPLRAEPPDRHFSLPAASARDREGFLLALPGYSYHFPRDGGAHPGYKTEWWYYTGHLSDGSREYGFELTLFRNELQAHPPVRQSHWATNTVYLGHFAITDISRGHFHFAERVDRGALGTAGAATS